MAVPKKRTGHSAQGHRRSNWKALKPETTKCNNCGALVLTHTVCTACGYYKGKAVSIKSPDYVETILAPKKVSKTTKNVKEKKAEEIKIQEKKETEITEPEVKAETEVETEEEVKSEVKTKEEE